MIYALDTNIISYILRDEYGVRERWRTEEALGNRAVIPVIVYYEAKRGLVYKGAADKLKSFERLCGSLSIKNLSVKDVDAASIIYSEGKKKGRPIEDADLLIAAQAVARGYTLVTNNIKHFKDIAGLRVENWVIK